jgi:hypothetical protein
MLNSSKINLILFWVLVIWRMSGICSYDIYWQMVGDDGGAWRFTTADDVGSASWTGRFAA